MLRNEAEAQKVIRHHANIIQADMERPKSACEVIENCSASLWYYLVVQMLIPRH